MHATAAHRPPAVVPRATAQVRRFVRDGVRVGLEILIEGTLPFATDDVFAWLTDVDKVRAHPGVYALTVLEAPGGRRSGPGSLREVRLRSGTFQERIVAVEPGRSITYAVEQASVPMTHHGGKILLTPTDAGTAVRWQSAFSVEVPVLGPIVASVAAHVMACDLRRHVEALGPLLHAAGVPVVDSPAESAA